MISGCVFPCSKTTGPGRPPWVAAFTGTCRALLRSLAVIHRERLQDITWASAASPMCLPAFEPGSEPCGMYDLVLSTLVSSTVLFRDTGATSPSPSRRPRSGCASLGGVPREVLDACHDLSEKGFCQLAFGALVTHQPSVPLMRSTRRRAATYVRVVKARR